jgi:hypothetical protein
MRDEDPPSTSSMTDLVLEDMGNDAAILHTIPNGAVCRHAAADWQTADHRLLLLLQVFLLRTKLHKAQFEKVTDMVAVLGLLGIASQPVQAELLPRYKQPAICWCIEHQMALFGSKCRWTSIDTTL